MAWTPTKTPEAPDPFSLAKQFDAMRNGAEGGGEGGMSTAAYQPASQGGSVGAAVGAQGGDYSGRPSGYSAAGSPDGSNLVDYGGYKFNKDFVGIVDDVAKRFSGLRIGSGYRTPEANASANGVQNSWHLSGNAVDFSGSAKDMQAAAGYAQSKGYRVLIHNAGSGMHLHVSR